MWNERYSDPDYVYGTQPNGFLKTMASRIPAGRVLCLAEGEGRNAVFLAERGFEVVGVDQSSVGLQKAQRLATSRGVKIQTVEADLADYEIKPGAWSGIVSIFCHLPPAIRSRVHRRVIEGLQSGGVFVLEAYTPAQLNFKTGGPSSVELLMTLDQLKDELAGLEFEHAAELERDIVEGKFHTGRGAVVQVVARKA